jgi:hypothetical protein
MCGKESQPIFEGRLGSTTVEPRQNTKLMQEFIRNTCEKLRKERMKTSFVTL